LSASSSNRCVHFDTVSRQVFGDIQETQFSGSKNGISRSSEKYFPGENGTRRITFGYNLWFASHPSLRRILFHKKSGPRRNFLIFFCLNRDAFDLKFLVLSTNSLVVKIIPTPILSDHNDKICTEQ